jgi:hypothetical protein
MMPFLYVHPLVSLAAGAALPWVVATEFWLNACGLYPRR